MCVVRPCACERVHACVPPGSGGGRSPRSLWGVPPCRRDWLCLSNVQGGDMGLGAVWWERRATKVKAVTEQVSCKMNVDFCYATPITVMQSCV